MRDTRSVTGPTRPARFQPRSALSSQLSTLDSRLSTKKDEPPKFGGSSADERCRSCGEARNRVPVGYRNSQGRGTLVDSASSTDTSLHIDRGLIDDSGGGSGGELDQPAKGCGCRPTGSILYCCELRFERSYSGVRLELFKTSAACRSLSNPAASARATAERISS
ncbi:hypothetical protein Pan189_35380 [Stratiformator vulcanicus]|uniref:Uncharacterized protein n=1 Tax=Stratiformator vulcanicus TaxID=2527980 RepID=A0A517R5M4_9PLAN|nr:hypothetical protein Pan189_35380 [Stratiformator vulcanicus]